MLKKFGIGTAILTGIMALVAGDFSADLSGTWTGFADIRTEDCASNRLALRTAFRQNGSSLTGILGPSADAQSAAREGLVQGDAVSFLAAMPERIYKFQMTLTADDCLKGEVRAADGKASGLRLELQHRWRRSRRRSGARDL